MAHFCITFVSFAAVLALTTGHPTRVARAFNPGPMLTLRTQAGVHSTDDSLGRCFDINSDIPTKLEMSTTGVGSYSLVTYSTGCSETENVIDGAHAQSFTGVATVNPRRGICSFILGHRPSTEVTVTFRGVNQGQVKSHGVTEIECVDICSDAAWAEYSVKAEITVNSQASSSYIYVFSDNECGNPVAEGIKVRNGANLVSFTTQTPSRRPANSFLISRN